MGPSPAFVAIAAAVLILFSTVHATVETTCKAAANSDSRVDYGFCVSELSHYRGSSDADTWGLAKIAALVGVVNADNTVYDIKDLLAKPGADAREQAALAQCQWFYDEIGFAFAEAQDDINSRDYVAGKEKTAEAIALAHQCDAAFDKVVAPLALTKHSSYSVKIAIVCTAIVNLVK